MVPWRGVLMTGLLVLARMGLAEPVLSMHPACLEPLFGSLETPFPASLDLQACSRDHGEAPVRHRGAMRLHERPADDGRGSVRVGYEVLGRDGEHVLLRVEEDQGPGESLTNLVLAVHRPGSGQLEGLRELPTGRGCALGFLDGGPGGDGALDVTLGLTPAHLLKALVAPAGQLPREARDHRRALMAFGIETMTAVPSRPGSCIGHGRWRHEPETGQWQPQALRLSTLKHFDRIGDDCFYRVLMEHSVSNPDGGWLLDTSVLPGALKECPGVFLEGLPELSRGSVDMNQSGLEQIASQ